MTRKKKMNTEQANKKLNATFYGEEIAEYDDVEQLLNYHQSEDVVTNSKENDKDNEDM